MLDRIWLILILVLASFVAPMHAAPASAGTDTSVMACCAGECACKDCLCAIRDSQDPAERDPAAPTQPEREQKRTAEPGFAVADMVGGGEPARALPRPGGSMAWRWQGVRRLESVFCVWRI